MIDGEVRVSRLACVMARSDVTHFASIQGFNGDDCGCRALVLSRVNLNGCEGDPRSATKGRTTEIVIKEDEEVSDYEYPIGDVLGKGRHRDGSMYRAMGDVYWKKEYRVADRRESKSS